MLTETPLTPTAPDAVARIPAAAGQHRQGRPRGSRPVARVAAAGMRPLVGRDIESFRARHRLQVADVVHALGLATPASYGKACRQPILPVAQELLLRLYDLHPGMIPWNTPSMKEAFHMLYGDVLKQWAGTEFEDSARIVLYGRFTALLGRTAYNAYRWIEHQGKASTEIERIFAKLTLLVHPREEIERVARLVLRLRGHDLDAMFPLPTLESPPARRGPGRPAANAERVPRPPRLRLNDYILNNLDVIFEKLRASGCPPEEIEPLKQIFRKGKA